MSETTTGVTDLPRSAADEISGVLRRFWPTSSPFT